MNPKSNKENIVQTLKIFIQNIEESDRVDYCKIDSFNETEEIFDEFGFGLQRKLTGWTNITITTRIYTEIKP